MLAGLFASIAVTEIYIRLQVVPRDEFVNYKSKFWHGTAETAAFGDSHVASGLVDLPIIDNLGQPSDNLSTTLEKALHRAARGGVRQIVLQADPHMFSAYRLGVNQANRMKSLLSQGRPTLVIMRPEYRQYLTRFWWTAVSNPSDIFRASNVEKRAELPVAVNAGDQEQRRKQALMRVQLHTPIPNIYTSKAPNEYREGIVRLKRLGLRVCLVGYPLSSHYREAAESLPSFAIARSFFKNVARDLQVPYFDYASAIGDEGFGDPDHLLPAAANTFTQLVLHSCSKDR